MLTFLIFNCRMYHITYFKLYNLKRKGGFLNLRKFFALLTSIILLSTFAVSASEETIIYKGGGKFTFFNESHWYIKNDVWTEGKYRALYRDDVLYISLYDFRDAFDCAVYHNVDENCICVKFSDKDIWQGIGNNDLYLSGVIYYNPAPYINDEGVVMIPVEVYASVIEYVGKFEVLEDYPPGQMTLVAPPVPHTLSYIELNEEAQLVTVYGKNPSGEITPVKHMICSTGVDGCTPNGSYKINPVGGTWTYFPKYNCYVMYCSQVIGDVCFHSIPFNSKNYNSLSWTGYSNIGNEASHGCIRLFTEDAMFIYKNCKDLSINIVNGYTNEETDNIRNKIISEKLSYSDYIEKLRNGNY